MHLRKMSAPFARRQRSADASCDRSRAIAQTLSQSAHFVLRTTSDFSGGRLRTRGVPSKRHPSRTHLRIRRSPIQNVPSDSWARRAARAKPRARSEDWSYQRTEKDSSCVRECERNTKHEALDERRWPPLPGKPYGFEGKDRCAPGKLPMAEDSAVSAQFQLDSNLDSQHITRVL